MHFLLDKVIDLVYFKINKIGVISLEIRIKRFLVKNLYSKGGTNGTIHRGT
jgi:hypothetical protein